MLRERATRLFALALQVSEHGDQALADELTNAANYVLDQAERLERENKAIRPPSTKSGSQHVTQQQKPKPESGKD
jgi:hypothetical protein